MRSFTRVTSHVVVLARDHVDTDQIIPARFLKTTTATGLGDHLFADWRQDPDFVLNQPQAKGAQLLVTGHNFGCGSSREHAPWALGDWGFLALLAPSFADIFRQNALKNGLLPVALPAEVVDDLMRLPVAATYQLTVDLERQVVVMPDGRQVGFAVDPFSRHCLLHGVDSLDYLLAKQEQIAAFEQSLPAFAQATHARRTGTTGG